MVGAESGLRVDARHLDGHGLTAVEDRHKDRVRVREGDLALEGGPVESGADVDVVDGSGVGDGGVVDHDGARVVAGGEQLAGGVARVLGLPEGAVGRVQGGVGGAGEAGLGRRGDTRHVVGGGQRGRARREQDEVDLGRLDEWAAVVTQGPAAAVGAVGLGARQAGEVGLVERGVRSGVRRGGEDAVLAEGVRHHRRG